MQRRIHILVAVVSVVSVFAWARLAMGGECLGLVFY